MSAADLKVAIAGAGMISDSHRRGALLAGAQVMGVLASTPERSAEAGAKWGVRGYASYDELLADDVDVVHIATPNASHAPFALAALEAGKHVICEKPLGVNLEEAESMVAAADVAGKVNTVPFVYRFHPIVRELRDRRIKGELGDLNLIHGTYLQDWMLSPDVATWRTDPVAGGASRAFGDIGSHWVDLVEWVAGVRFETLVGATSIAYAERPTGSAAAFSGKGGGEYAKVTTEDSAVLILKTAEGLLANATISQLSAGRKNRLWFEMDGSKGSIVFDQETPESALFGSPQGMLRVQRDPGLGSNEIARLSQLPAGHSQGYTDAFDSFIADSYAAVLGTASQEVLDGLPTFRDGLRTAAITTALMSSAASGGWETIPGGDK